HKGLYGSDEQVVEVAAAVRRAVGPELAIMVDVQYAFDSVERALAVAEALAGHDVFFLETPLWVDDLAGYAELRRRSPVRIAQGEWLSTRFEFEALIRSEFADVVLRPPERPGLGVEIDADGLARFAAAAEQLVLS